PPQARFCGACGHALSTQITGFTRQHSSAPSFQPVHSVPASPRSRPPIIPTEPTLKQQPSAVPVPLTRKFPAVGAGLVLGAESPQGTGQRPALSVPTRSAPIQPSVVPVPLTRKLPAVGAESVLGAESPQGTIPTRSPLLKRRYQLIKQVGVGGYG